MARYALINAEIVVNLVIWEGIPPIIWPDNATAVLIPDDSPVDIDWTYKNGEFFGPINS